MKLCYNVEMQQPRAIDMLIAFLLSANSNKIYREILWSRIKKRNREINPAAFRQQLYRLEKRGLIKTNRQEVSFCRADLIKHITQKNFIMRDISPGKSEKVILSFDIPETKKKTRDWLRNQIKYWDFKMIHKSLWLGGGPLPKEFYRRLKDLKIDQNVKIFRVKNLKVT